MGISLKPRDYWELRARVNDIEAVELDLLKLRLDGERRLREAQAARTAAFDRIAPRYGLSGTAAYGWDDANHELIEKKD